jgi:hypothetical protein
VRPVKTEITDVVYRGPSPDIGDLWVHRVEPGVIMSVWEPSVQERELMAQGGRVVLWIHTEPIPPIALEIRDDYFTQPVAEHPYKVIPELDDPERSGS